MWLDSHAVLLGAVGVVSLVAMVTTLLAVPWLIVRLPADYFAVRHRQRLSPFTGRSGKALTLLVAKNLLGVVLLLVGTAMLVLPGQGVLTLLFAITLLDFPGKFRLERFVVSRRTAYRGINWLRRRAGKPRLLLPQRPHRIVSQQQAAGRDVSSRVR
jgi:hypothetical protein